MYLNCLYLHNVFEIAAFAAVRTLDDVTLISEATARAIHRLKQEESEQEENISCTASSTPSVKVMMRPALTQLIHDYPGVCFQDRLCQSGLSSQPCRVLSRRLPLCIKMVQ